jgi:ABC-type glycerol-3-phosphate transport system substrate-binding protein
MMTRIIKPLRPAVRHVLGATAVASSVLLLTCSSGSTQDSTDALDDPVTLTFWGTYGNGGNTAQTDVLERLIAEFEDLHPSIAVEYVDVPYDSLKQRLTTSAAGDELPDIVRADIDTPLVIAIAIEDVNGPAFNVRQPGAVQRPSRGAPTSE